MKGTPAHSSQIFREQFGHGAIFEAARILNAFREKMAGEEHLTFNPGVILGGTSAEYDAAQTRGSASGKTNVIAGETVAAGDLRTLSAAQLERAMQLMRQIVAGASATTQAAITFGEGYPPPRSRIRARCGGQPGQGRRRRRVLHRRQAKMILDGVGLMGHDDHTPEETADLSTLPSQTKRAALTLYRLRQR